MHMDIHGRYIAEIKNGRLERKMDHLVCFVPGTLALGAQHIPEVYVEHMALAKKLVRTCYEMYARQSTGLAPEFVKFNRGARDVGGGARETHMRMHMRMHVRMHGCTCRRTYAPRTHPSSGLTNLV